MPILPLIARYQFRQQLRQWDQQRASYYSSLGPKHDYLLLQINNLTQTVTVHVFAYVPHNLKTGVKTRLKTPVFATSDLTKLIVFVAKQTTGPIVISNANIPNNPLLDLTPVLAQRELAPYRNRLTTK